MGKVIEIDIKETDGTIKHIGTFYEDRKTFEKKVNKNKHLYKKLNAYGIDAKVVNEFLKPKAEWIQIYEIIDGSYYRVDIKTFLDKSLYLHFKPHRAQRFLSLKYWKKAGEDNIYAN